MIENMLKSLGFYLTEADVLEMVNKLNLKYTLDVDENGDTILVFEEA